MHGDNRAVVSGPLLTAYDNVKGRVGSHEEAAEKSASEPSSL